MRNFLGEQPRAAGIPRRDDLQFLVEGRMVDPRIEAAALGRFVRRVSGST
jgi:hypothetical protein